MKFKEGVNRFRILSPAITGYEYWNVLNKPVRQEKPFDLIPNDIKFNDDGSVSAIKHFWAFVVWNYEEKMVQILEITQATIQRGLKIKIDNREGKATENDFIITKSGKGLLTEYDIDVAEASPVSPEIMKAYEAKNISLEALFTGADPFTASDNKQAATGQTSGNNQVSDDGLDKEETPF
jgi:hypothetical protein